MPKFLCIFLGALSLLGGVVFVVFSGRAEGLFSARLAALGLLLLLNLSLSVVGILALVRFGSGPGLRVSWYPIIVLLSIVVADGMAIVGTRISNARVRETMIRGDKIIEAIEKFTKRNGRPPTTLEELSAKGYDVPRPALQGSKFNYIPGKRLSFNSEAFRICTRHERWVCDD